ncbi:diguanylate cyclase domain-containing protein [Micromonospora sp. BQ11]|uniref:diguanylate cyclase domain-containing protein n=1 Tax=Micromonospora sp. BQ11 TaxID=3452212 RepID=UPI003F8C3058
MTATTAVALVAAAWACYLIAALRRTRAHLADALRQLARDPLTGLLNRTGLLALHATLTATPHPMLVLLIDLDNFKAVNDTHGHDAGDHILTEIGARIHEIAALNGGAAARLAGDEYAALLPAHRGTPARVAGLVVALIAQPLDLPGDGEPTTVDVAASVGAAIVDSSDPLEDVALRRADIAMYHAKHSGGNQHTLYAPGMTMPATTPRRGRRLRNLRPTRPEAGA